MSQRNLNETLSPWWRNAVILVMIIGFSILIAITVMTYKHAPPIPEKVATETGETLFTGSDIIAGQQVFLKYGLMENGTIWGHGAYLGPDFSAAYLHTLTLDAAETLARQQYRRGWVELSADERKAISHGVQHLLKENRYNPETRVLRYTPAEVSSFREQKEKWRIYFNKPAVNRGLLIGQVKDVNELRQLTAFFAWASWASTTLRPGKDYSYTNNFPYDPMAGNNPSTDAVFWSAMSLITLLAGLAAALFAFGRFDYLGWHGKKEHVHPHLPPGLAMESQRAVIKYFVVVALLFLAQALVGGASVHYRADPTGFFGFDLSPYFPSNIFRTWHLQLAVFWIATSYVAGSSWRAHWERRSLKAKWLGLTSFLSH